MVITGGRCRNAACSIGAGAQVIERYPGPGEYCPECGEALEPVVDSRKGGGSAIPPLASLSPEAYRDFQDRMVSVLASAGRTPFWRRRFFLVSLTLVLIAAGAFAMLRPMAILGRPDRAAIHVCRSTITDRLATDVVRAYAATSGMPSSRFDIANSARCDVRFAAGNAHTAGHIVAHDGVVVVVNPSNPVNELTPDQLRAILTGTVTDWSVLGGPQGSIVTMAPTDGSDEAQTIAGAFLHGAKLGGAVIRPRSSTEIARAVASTAGQRSIGVVAFSASGAAKVVTIRSMPPPNSRSIAEHRYPLAVTVTVRAEGRTADPAAAGLVRYAGSGAARELVVRDGLVAQAR